MEDGRIKDIIVKLIDSVENGQNAPLSPGKVLVPKEETALMLHELASLLDSELKVYREVTDKKGKILTEAKQEAAEIVSEAQRSASRIRVSKKVLPITGKVVNDDLMAEDKDALRTAGDIYAASLIYTDEMLTEVNDAVNRAVDLVENEYKLVTKMLEEKSKLIEQNKAELMSSLKELSKEERYAQILELSQLLSNELYRERMKLVSADKKTERVHVERDTAEKDEEKS